MSTHSPAHAPTIPAGPAPVHNTVGTAPTGLAPRPAYSRIQGRQTLLRSVHAEWIKFWSLRSIWIASFITIALTVLFGAGLAAVLGQTEEYQDTTKNLITQGLTSGQVVVAILGALIITGEYSSGQIRSSLAVVPKRGQLLVSKAVVLAIVSFLLGSVSVLLSRAISKPFIGECAGSLTDSHYIGHIWGSGLVSATITLLTLELGFLLRSTAGTIIVIVSLLFIISGPLQLAASRWPRIFKIIGCPPNTVAKAVFDPFQRTTEWGGQGAQFLTHGRAIAVFAAWALTPLITAWIVFSRCDAWAGNSPAVSRRRAYVSPRVLSAGLRPRLTPRGPRRPSCLFSSRRSRRHSRVGHEEPGECRAARGPDQPRAPAPSHPLPADVVFPRSDAPRLRQRREPSPSPSSKAGASAAQVDVDHDPLE